MGITPSSEGRLTGGPFSGFLSGSLSIPLPPVRLYYPCEARCGVRPATVRASRLRREAAEAKGTCSHTFGALDTVQVGRGGVDWRTATGAGSEVSPAFVLDFPVHRLRLAED